MADTTERLPHPDPGNARGSAVFPPARRTRRRRAAMPDVHHPRCARSCADRGLDRALHRQAFDDLVLMTGEGLRRLMKVVRRIGARAGIHCRARPGAQICARPQARPGAARDRAGAAGDDREADFRRHRRDAVAHRSRGHRLGLQLYPDKDHSALIGAITAQGAEVDTVLPYVYDAQAADANIVTAIDEMAAGRIDAIALTSSGQVRRLVDVAQGARMRRPVARRAWRTRRSPRSGRWFRTN